MNKMSIIFILTFVVFFFSSMIALQTEKSLKYIGDYNDGYINVTVHRVNSENNKNDTIKYLLSIKSIKQNCSIFYRCDYYVDNDGGFLFKNDIINLGFSLGLFNIGIGNELCFEEIKKGDTLNCEIFTTREYIKRNLVKHKYMNINLNESIPVKYFILIYYIRNCNSKFNSKFKYKETENKYIFESEDITINQIEFIIEISDSLTNK